jgi:hypothetical protein
MLLVRLQHRELTRAQPSGSNPYVKDPVKAFNSQHLTLLQRLLLFGAISGIVLALRATQRDHYANEERLLGQRSLANRSRDKLYGGDEDLYLALVENRLTDDQRARLLLPFHALHARALEFTWNGKLLSLEAEPESWFAGFLS